MHPGLDRRVIARDHCSSDHCSLMSARATGDCSNVRVVCVPSTVLNFSPRLNLKVRLKSYQLWKLCLTTNARFIATVWLLLTSSIIFALFILRKIEKLEG